MFCEVVTDYIPGVPWSQVFILHLWVNQSMTFCDVDVLVLLGKAVVFF